MIINFRYINYEKIWETSDLKNYVNNFIFPPNRSYFLRIQQNWGHDNFEKIKKNSKNPLRYSEKIWKIRALLEKSQIFSFFALRYGRVLFKNQRKSEKWWGKRWEFKKRIGEKFRKTVENECFGKISLFLINVPKPTENLRKFLQKFWRNFWESLRKFLRKSEKYFDQGGNEDGGHFDGLIVCEETWSSSSSTSQIFFTRAHCINVKENSRLRENSVMHFRDFQST